MDKRDVRLMLCAYAGFVGDPDRSCTAAESQASDELREGEDMDIGVFCRGEALGVTQAGASTGELYAAILSFSSL